MTHSDFISLLCLGAQRKGMVIIMRKIALLLLISMLASLTACGSGTPSADTTASSGDTTAATNTPAVTDTLEARKLVDDELPKKDFGGEKFLILGETDSQNDLEVEETTGDVVLDAVYKRNRTVEERFNVELDFSLVDYYEKLATSIKTSVNAGDDSYQLVNGHAVGLGTLAMDGYLLNWCDLDYINFEKPWWSPSALDELTYNNHSFLAVGNYALDSISQIYCVFFNKRLVDEYSIPDPYATVMDGKWTIDYLISITKDAYKDMNNNGKDDEQDFYGFMTNAGSQANAFFWAFDERVISHDKEKGLKVTYKDGKINEIVEKLVTMIEDNPGITHCGTTGANFEYFTGKNQQYTMYPNGQGIFTTCIIGGALVSQFREMKDDFGILPYPKWDENQELYRTMADGSHSALCAPVTVGDTERLAILTEALNAESYKQVVPAFYDVALKVKGTRDETSVQILDMITNGCVYDMGYVYDGWKGASFIIQKLVREGNTNFESYWASNSPAIIAWYDTVIDCFKGEKK